MPVTVRPKNTGTWDVNTSYSTIPEPGFALSVVVVSLWLTPKVHQFNVIIIVPKTVLAGEENFKKLKNKKNND